jgi:PPM family protein phosphatase
MQSTREFKITNEITASVQTDTGCVREANEDAGRHVSPNDKEILLRKGTLTIVADGMGGHASGEIASAMAIDLIGEIYYADVQNPPALALKNAIETASAEIFETSLTNEKYFGMGTTVAALVVLSETAIAAHVGDSRIYRLSGGKMEMLTLDHSQVMEMVKHGILTMDEAREHDDKNVILRAVGTQASVEAEISAPFAVEPNDEFLLCSDGLSDMLTDDEIWEIWANCRDIHAACERLIEAAKQRGGHDNITVGIVRVAPKAEAAETQNVRATREIEIV